ncbi:hypothetical protein [Xanthomonas citri]|nr:hypothetical protein [Xanthomonas citri]
MVASALRIQRSNGDSGLTLNLANQRCVTAIQDAADKPRCTNAAQQGSST